MIEDHLTFIFGILAGSCTTFSFLPQIHQLWRRRSAEDISAVMYSIFSTGSLLWLIYGLRLHSAPVTIANAITLALNLWVLFLKWKFTVEKRRAPLPKRSLL